MPLRNKSGEEFYRPWEQRTFKPDGVLPSLAPASSQGVFLLPRFDTSLSQSLQWWETACSWKLYHPQGHGDSDLIPLIYKMGIQRWCILQLRICST